MISKLAVLLLFIAITIGGCNSKYLVAPQQGNQQFAAQTTTSAISATTQRTFTCQCGDSAEPICANNGVTYKNMCRFECAQSKVNRLRVVKEGECGKYLSKLQFWVFG